MSAGESSGRGFSVSSFSGVRGNKRRFSGVLGTVEMGASRGMMVLLVKQVHLQKEVGAVVHR